MNTPSPTLSTVLSRCLPFFGYALVFSFCVELLGLGAPLYMMAVFDRVLHSRSNETLVVLTGIFVFAILIEVVIEKLLVQLFKRLGDTVFLKLRDTVLKGLLSFRQKPEEAVHGFDELETLRNFLSGHGLRALYEIPWIPVFLFVLWLFHPLLFMVALLSAVLMIALTYLDEEITRKNQLKADLKQKESREFLAHAVNNNEIVAALSMNDAIGERWKAINNEYFDAAVRAGKRAGAIEGLSRLVNKLQRVVGLGTGAFLVLNVDGITPGIMLAATIFMRKALHPMTVVIGSWRSFQLARDAYSRLDRLLEEILARRPGFQPPAPKGAVSVENLLYFIDRERTILNGVNFQLEPGEALGIVGPSAAGKTTLARLLVGIVPPSDGSVRLDGVEVAQWCPNGLGRWLGYLPQQQQLFSGTVADNIARMGDSRQCVEQVLKAARRAGVHELILRMPKGYDTEAGPGGAFLSGGQRQLIALARAVFGDPAYLVLDEPNAFLDGHAEALLLEMIVRLKREGVTQIIVSHKPSVLRDVDKLLVLGPNKPLMFGPREEILRRMKLSSAEMPVSPEALLARSAA